MNAKDNRGQDDLHRRVNVKALQFISTHPEARSSGLEDILWNDSLRWVSRVARALLDGQPGIDPEEVAAVAIEKAWLGLRSFQNNSQFTTWLFTITIRTVADFRRGIRSNVMSLDELNVDELPRSASQPGLSTPQVGIEEYSDFNQQLSKLPPDEAAILKSWANRESSREIGRTHGISAEAVRQRIRRILERLRKDETVNKDRKQVDRLELNLPYAGGLHKE